MKSSDEMIEAIYLRTLSRQPSEEELNYFRQYVNGVEDAKQAYEDVVWALVNSKQFLFVH
jgi:transcription termination factor NusB